MTVKNSPRPELAVLLVTAVWLGLLLGVSFIATPVKFTARTLPLPVALEVGRVTFALFNRIEWGMLVLLFVFARAARISGPGFWSVLGLSGLLAAQTFWLLPILDLRVGEIIGGGVAPASYHHWVYIAAELAKLVFAGVILWTGSTKLLATKLLAKRAQSSG